MTEHEKARAWRLKHELSPKLLSQMIGYSVESIHAMERGLAPAGKGVKSRAIKDNVWRRYKCACAAVDAHLVLEHKFNWN